MNDEGPVSNVLANGFGDPEGLLSACARQGNDELVATVACGDLLQSRANLGQQPAADEVAVRVVDLLEMVEVEENDPAFGIVGDCVVDDL